MPLRHNFVLAYYYLHQGGYVITCVCLFVSRLCKKPLNRFALNLVEGWGHGAGENPNKFWGKLRSFPMNLIFSSKV